MDECKEQLGQLFNSKDAVFVFKNSIDAQLIEHEKLSNFISDENSDRH